MAEPLTPISGNEQRARTPYTAASFKSFAAADTHHRSQHIDNFDPSPDQVAPSSPFLYEAERSSRSPNKHISSPSKTRGISTSPQKIALNDLRQRVPLTEEMLRANETGLETPRTGQLKHSSTSQRHYSPSESAYSAFSAIPNADMTMFAKLGLSPSKSPSKRGSQDEKGSTTPTRSRPNTPGTTRPNRTQERADVSSPLGAEEDSTTQLIDFTEQLNLAGHMNRSPVRTRNSPSKDARERQQPRLGSPIRDAAGFKPATPSQVRELASLLDFDLPPAPTPRSVPTISARELEGLKAGFLSQISALKATISGKEAEVLALKAASQDAEERVGGALEQLRESKDIRDALEQEKADWEARDRETQRVLKEVRAQIHDSEKDRLQMEDRLAEAERRAEDAEMKAQEAESKAVGAAAGAEAAGGSSNADGEAGSPGTAANKAVQAAVEKVARELHALYKAKHESKVGQLKKSYEARWSKKNESLKGDVERLEKELQDSRMEVDALRHELDEVKLKQGRVDAMTTVDPGKLEELQAKEKEVASLKNEIGGLKADLDKVRAEKQELDTRADTLASGAVGTSEKTKGLEDKIASLSTEVEQLHATTRRLRRDLELSREENSQLVATVDEFLAMDLGPALPTTGTAVASAALPPAADGDERPVSSHAGSTSSLSRPGSALGGATRESAAGKPTGLKGPSTFGFSQSRIGMGPASMKRSVSGSKSGIMSNIERMGRARGAEQ